MYKNKIMTIIGLFAWILGVAIPFFMNQSDASLVMLAFGWVFPVAGYMIDDY